MGKREIGKLENRNAETGESENGKEQTGDRIDRTKGVEEQDDETAEGKWEIG